MTFLIYWSVKEERMTIHNLYQVVKKIYNEMNTYLFHTSKII